MTELPVQKRAGGVRFAVRVQPRASRSEIDGVLGDAIKVRVAALPADGVANEELMVVLAKALGVKVRAVRIVRGATSRSKIVEVDGIDAELVRELVIRDL